MSSTGNVNSPVPRRRFGRRFVVVIGLLLVCLIAVGAYFRPRQGASVELPEIPTVNLDGADPEISKVVGMARKSVEQNPRTAATWGHMGMILHAHGFSDAAQTCYQAAANLEHKTPFWPYLRGHLYQHGPGGPEAALSHFQLAASRAPANSMAQLRLAETLLELGRLEEAEAEYRKTLAAAKDDPLAQLGLGKVAVARRQYREALEYLEAVSGSPLTQNESCAMRASVHDRLGESTAAERERERLAELPEDGLRPDDPMILVLQMEVGVRVQLANAEKLMAQNRIADVMVVVENAVHRYPDSFEAWAALGNACGMAGDPAGAEKAVRKSIQLAPKNAEGWLSLANVQIWQRRHQEAMESIQKSLALNPKNGAAYFSLGECRRALGDTAGAAEAYRDVLRYAPKHPQAKERLEELKAIR